jgi:hypothetical protein
MHQGRARRWGGRPRGGSRGARCRRGLRCGPRYGQTNGTPARAADTSATAAKFGEFGHRSASRLQSEHHFARPRVCPARNARLRDNADLRPRNVPPAVRQVGRDGCPPRPRGRWCPGCVPGSSSARPTIGSCVSAGSVLVALSDSHQSSNPPAPAPQSWFPETMVVCKKVPAFPGVCAPKPVSEIGDSRKWPVRPFFAPLTSTGNTKRAEWPV